MKKFLLPLIAMFLVTPSAFADRGFEPEPEEERSGKVFRTNDTKVCVYGTEDEPKVSQKLISNCEKFGGRIMTRKEIKGSGNSKLKDALKRSE